MRVRRCLLFMPGDSRRKIEKGALSGVDSVIMDLEDGVAPAHKADARAVIAAALDQLDFGRTEKLVRVNPFASPFYADDLDAILKHQPEGVVLPKVESKAALDDFDARLLAFERAYGLALNSLPALIMIETALGVARIHELLPAPPRVQGVIFGAEDFAASIGATRTPHGVEVAYARGAVLTHAKAYGLQAIDQVYVAFQDAEGLTAETLQARGMGFDGKQAIHPNQIAPIHTAFTPTDAEIERAQQLLAAYAESEAAGAGAFAFEGQMVDMPVIRAAQSVIARAQAAGAI